MAALLVSACDAAPPTPLELLMRRAEGPAAFGEGDKHRLPRLFGVSLNEAQAALASCREADWIQTGERIQQGFTMGSGQTLDFKCGSADVIILAEVLVDPMVGMDGAAFAACRPDDCPSPVVAFDYRFRE